MTPPTAMPTIATSAHSRARRMTWPLSSAAATVLTSEMPTSSRNGTNHSGPISRSSSCRPWRVARRSRGWLRIRWVMGRRKRSTNSALRSAAVTLASRPANCETPGPNTLMISGSCSESPSAARLPISHSGGSARRCRMSSARVRCGPSSSVRQISDSDENNAPASST